MLPSFEQQGGLWKGLCTGSDCFFLGRDTYLILYDTKFFNLLLRSTALLKAAGLDVYIIKWDWLAL